MHRPLDLAIGEPIEGLLLVTPDGKRIDRHGLSRIRRRRRGSGRRPGGWPAGESDRLGKQGYLREITAIPVLYGEGVAGRIRAAVGGPVKAFMLLTHESRPSQIPLRSLLPNELDNLLAPVCLSAIHVGIGNLRVEPVLMHLAESAAWVAILACHAGATVAAIPAREVQTALLANRVAIAFFDDLPLDPSDDKSAAAQYLSTQGFFPTYET